MAKSGGLRRLATWAAALSCMVGVTVLPAGAAEVKDSAGDAGDCRGDVVRSTTTAGAGPSLTLDLQTACPLPGPPSSWPSGTEILWELDVDGDDAVDWTVRAASGGSDVQVGPGVSGTPPNNCQPRQIFGGDPPSWRGVIFSARCIGSPANVRTRVTVRWAGGPADVAPNVGFGPADSLPPPARPATTRHGYWMIDRSGATYAFGDAEWLGNTAAPADVVDIEPTLSGRGYWTVDALGHVYAFGDAKPLAFPEPTPGWSPLRAGERVTSISRRVVPGWTPSEDRVDELWVYTDRGAVYVAGGHSNRYGDLSTMRLNGPVVDSVARNDGLGYWMVASDGGIFTFGLARFFGSMGDQHLNSPVQSLVPDPDGVGYWLVAGDGGVFAFDAPFLGSMGHTPLNKPVVGMVSSGDGYLMVASDGGIFTFGEASFYGSLGDRPPAAPVVAVAALDV